MKSTLRLQRNTATIVDLRALLKTTFGPLSAKLDSRFYETLRTFDECIATES